MASRKRPPAKKSSGEKPAKRKDAPKIQRWVDLVAFLLAHRTPRTFAEIERDVIGYQGKNKDARKRMFERDKKELKALGVPIETVGDEGDDESAYRLRTTQFYMPYLAVATSRGTSTPRRVDRYGYHSLPTLAFEPDELAAVAEAAARARMLGDPALAEHVESAMQKLAFDLPMAVTAPAPPHVVPPRASADPKVLERLGEALLARKRVEIAYHSMSSGATTRRMVEPYGLFFLNAHWYLAARDVERGDVRNFRVSRIRDAEMNTKREETADYEIPAAFDLREHARSKQAWELGDGEPVHAVVEFRGESGAARAAVALGAEVPDRPDQRRFAVRRPDAFARWLLSFAGEAVPLSPPAMVDEFRRLVADTRTVYSARSRSAEVMP